MKRVATPESQTFVMVHPTINLCLQIVSQQNQWTLFLFRRTCPSSWNSSLFSSIRSCKSSRLPFCSIKEYPSISKCTFVGPAVQSGSIQMPNCENSTFDTQCGHLLSRVHFEVSPSPEVRTAIHLRHKYPSQPSEKRVVGKVKIQ